MFAHSLNPTEQDQETLRPINHLDCLNRKITRFMIPNS